MADLAFDFSAPVVDPSQFAPTGEARAPIQQRGSLRSRHASAEGAKAVEPHVERQARQVLECYRQHGPLCDTEVEIKTGIARSSVIPRRRALMKQGRVVEVAAFRKNPISGKNNTAYDVVRL